LKAQQVQLLRVGAFIDDERGLLLLQLARLAHQRREAFAQRGQTGEGVQNVQLAGRMQERLMLVRPVHIDQFLAQGGEHLERGGGTVDELAVGPGGGEDAFEDQLMVRARFQSVFLKKAGRHGAAVAGDRKRLRPRNCRNRRARGCDRPVRPAAG
jgi:hypothetical protein